MLPWACPALTLVKVSEGIPTQAFGVSVWAAPSSLAFYSAELSYLAHPEIWPLSLQLRGTPQSPWTRACHASQEMGHRELEWLVGLLMGFLCFLSLQFALLDADKALTSYFNCYILPRFMVNYRINKNLTLVTLSSPEQESIQTYF